MNINRKNYQKILSSKYKRLTQINYTRCIYCDDYADAVDHTPNLKHLFLIFKSDYERYQDIKCFLVPSCRDCNYLLKSTRQHNPQGRFSYLETAFRKKYHKWLNQTHWSKEELNDLGRNLRSMIDDGIQAASKHLDYRYENIQSKLDLLIRSNAACFKDFEELFSVGY